jgi:hypothetical protein
MTQDSWNLPVSVRVFWVFWELIVNTVFSTAMISGVWILLSHELDFERDPFYSPVESESGQH